jgi:hypothetical protein
MSSEEAPLCPICLCDIEDPVNICDENHESTCRGCLSNYLESNISSAYFGTCPQIVCPSTSHQKAKKKKILPIKEWSTIAPPEISTRYKALASHLLAFLCGGCHTLKTLDVGYEATHGTAANKISSLLGERFPEYQDSLNQFCHGDIDLETFYTQLNSNFFPQLKVVSDQEAWSEMFLHLLKLIEEPERRCNLQLRYLRDRPRMKTLCCNREHCFRCKIKDFHEGKTCLEYSSTLDNSIVTCPSCGIFLARGDGCNTITCVCGKQFSWSVEKENSDRCLQFLSSFPNHTSDECAIILCGFNSSNPAMNPSNYTPTLMSQARAWQIRNRLDVNRALRNHFKRLYSPYPAQGCAILKADQQTDGIREAMELYKTEFSQQVEHCRKQNEIALKAIFEDRVPIVNERAAYAFHLTTLPKSNWTEDLGIEKKLIESANLWITTHRNEYNLALEEMEVKSANQFLSIFGNQTIVSLKRSQSAFPTISEFNRTISNNDLAFTNNNTTVERPGSVSCYPAAFASLVAERCIFRVQVITAPRSSNWLTFGLAKRGMATSSSDGVGRTANSWGLSDDRSSGSSHTIIASCGSEVASFRKLKVDDVLMALVDVTEGWIEIRINETEFQHRFTIAPGSMEDYWFAMTFANDHRVTILSDSVSDALLPTTATTTTALLTEVTPSILELNRDHSMMFGNYKKHIKIILTEDDELQLKPAPTSLLTTEGEKWVAQCGQSDIIAQEQFELLRGPLEYIINMKRPDSTNDASWTQSSGYQLLQYLSCQMILEAVSWYRQNRDRLKDVRKGDLAFTYSLTHGDSAPFMAAMILLQVAAKPNDHNIDRYEVEAAQAYVQYFAEEMEEWYRLDAMSGEPLVENVAKDCQCLPRHIRTCPKASKR